MSGHKLWGAGEADCPADIKASNGELHTLRCKVCGRDNDNNSCPEAGCDWPEKVSEPSERFSGNDKRYQEGRNDGWEEGWNACVEEFHRVRKPITVDEIMVNRFLSWPLPSSVCSDPCVTVSGYKGPRIGTNFLTADEAKAMLEYVLWNVTNQQMVEALAEATP
jgi:hypothetical protein